MSFTRNFSNSCNPPTPSKLSKLLGFFGLSSSSTKISRSEGEEILAKARANSELTQKIISDFEVSLPRAEETLERANIALGRKS